MWCRWKAGYHVREIARALVRDHGSMRGLLARRGGIAPSVRTLGGLALTLVAREDEHHVKQNLALVYADRDIAENPVSLELHVVG